MEVQEQTLLLKEHESVDRLNNLDQFFRQNSNQPIRVDASDCKALPTPNLQILISAQTYWSQRDLEFTVENIGEDLASNLEIVGVEQSNFKAKGASEI